MIGIVQQEPVLFNASIYENIALGDISITQAHVEEACRIANAQEFVSNLPQVRDCCVYFYRNAILSATIQLSDPALFNCLEVKNKESVREFELVRLMFVI